MTLSRVNVKIIAITGLMIALTAIMSFTPLGSIPLPWASITIAFLPAMLTAMTVGFWPAVAVGASAGIFSFIRATYTVTILQPFMLNPLVSVLPRIMIAVAVFFAFHAFLKLKMPRGIAAAISGAIGGITNTVLVLGAVWLFRGTAMGLEASARIDAAASENFNSIWTFIVFAVTTNAVFEVIAYTILCAAIVMGLKRAKFLEK